MICNLYSLLGAGPKTISYSKGRLEKVYDCVIKELFDVQSNSKDAKGKFGESS